MNRHSASGIQVRQLDPTEERFARIGLYTGYVTRVRGPLDLLVLSEAFGLLQHKYPILSCRIVQDPTTGQPYFEAAHELSPVVDWRDSESAEPALVLAGRVAAIQVVRTDVDTAQVNLLTHHAVADGPHSLQLLSDLWRIYTAVTAGHHARSPSHPFPRSPEQLLAERGFSFDPDEIPEVSLVPGSTLERADVSVPTVRGPRVRLTAEQTKALVALGHRAKTTINGLVSAALLIATADTLGIGLSDVLYTYPVNLRTRITPLVGFTDGTNVLGSALFIPRQDTPADLVTLACAVNDQLARDLAAGRIQRSMLAPAEQFDVMVPVIQAHPGSVLATNWGKIPALATPAGLAVEDFEPGVHLETTLSGPAVALPSPPRSCIITSFCGQLTIDLVGFDGADVFAERLGAVLTRLPVVA
ncbi:phthiocerol/phthiodiolone dimycocerosyl transferase family protein [Nocardia brasiliensis]|uniref:phthiocerol/phthiodiolone dimycocerosyl transferase family protein n=1 Tax=Nocardia brasiliensis TaxID=37326 RepID=UPI003D8F27E2